MKKELITLIDKLAAEHKLSKEEYITLLTDCGTEEAAYLAKKAREEKEKYYGNKNLLVQGGNIAGFEKVAAAMMEQGLV